MPSLNRNSGEIETSLRALAEASLVQANPAIEQRLLVHFRKHQAQKRRRMSLALLAASVAIIAAFSSAPWHRPARPHAIAPTDPAFGFIALPYAQSGVPLEQAVIVRVNIPISELGIMGMPHPPAISRKNVRADLLIGQDGVARAVRLIE